MARGYLIAQITVTDPESYARYVAMVQPTIEAFGGRFIVRAGKSVSYGGTPPGERNVVIEFPSYEAAQEWFHSDLYAQAKALRESASTSIQTLVEGV